jgi:hypothetical protein
VQDEFFGAIDAGRASLTSDDAFAATPITSSTVPAGTAAVQATQPDDPSADEGFEVNFDDFGVEPVPAPSPAPAPPPVPAEVSEPAVQQHQQVMPDPATGGNHQPVQPQTPSANAIATDVDYSFSGGDASFSAVWAMDDDGGKRAPAQLTVSVAGVRALFMNEHSQWKTIFLSDFFHIKSWDVGQGHFGLKIMELPRGGAAQKAVELSFKFLTTEARVIAGNVKAQVDQLIAAKQSGSGEAIVCWEPYQMFFRANFPTPPSSRPLPLLTLLRVFAGVILPPHNQSNVEYVKSDLRLRYFKNQPVQMELLDGDAAKTDTEEVGDGARLQLQVDDQVRVHAIAHSCCSHRKLIALAIGHFDRPLWSTGTGLRRKRRPQRWRYHGKVHELQTVASESPTAVACLLAVPRRPTASVEESRRCSHRLVLEL